MTVFLIEYNEYAKKYLHTGDMTELTPELVKECNLHYMQCFIDAWNNPKHEGYIPISAHCYLCSSCCISCCPNSYDKSYKCTCIDIIRNEMQKLEPGFYADIDPLDMKNVTTSIGLICNPYMAIAHISIMNSAN